MVRRKNGNSPITNDTGKSMEKENQNLRTALIEIAAEEWRFKHALVKALQNMDVMEAERFSRQYSYFSTRVSRAMSLAGLSCLDLSGQPYDVGMAVQGMNIEEFDDDEDLIITVMVEPVILCDGKVVRTGMAMLGRAANIPKTEE